MTSQALRRRAEAAARGNAAGHADPVLLLAPSRGLGAKLGDAAALRARENHTYENRLTVILEKLS